MGKIGPDTPIDNIGFSFRTRNSLRRAHIDTLKDLMDAYEKGEVRCIRNLGKVQERLDHLSMEERILMTEGEIVSILRKDYFRACDPKKLSKYARYRGMSSEKYSRFLTGMPLITTTTTVTDERIEQFLSEYYRDGQISMPKGENCHWFRSFMSRNGYTMKDVREMYGF